MRPYMCPQQCRGVPLYILRINFISIFITTFQALLNYLYYTRFYLLCQHFLYTYIFLLYQSPLLTMLLYINISEVNIHNNIKNILCSIYVIINLFVLSYYLFFMLPIYFHRYTRAPNIKNYTLCAISTMLRTQYRSNTHAPICS